MPMTKKSYFSPKVIGQKVGKKRGIPPSFPCGVDSLPSSLKIIPPTLASGVMGIRSVGMEAGGGRCPEPEHDCAGRERGVDGAEELSSCAVNVGGNGRPLNDPPRPTGVGRPDPLRPQFDPIELDRNLGVMTRTESRFIDILCRLPPN